MSIAIGFWSQELTPGNEEVIIPIADLKVSNVALGETLVDPNGRSTVKIVYSCLRPSDADEDENDDEDEDEVEDKDEDEDEDGEPKEITTVLCSLTAGKFEHTTTDIVLEKDEKYIFTVVGKNSVFLSGNYIDQAGLDNSPFYDSDVEEDREGLVEIDSDVDMNSEVEELVKNLKRPRESEVSTTDKEKSQADKKNKKMKAGNGQAVPISPGKDEKADNKDEKKGDSKEKKKEKKEKKKAGEETKSKPVEKELAGGLKIWDAVPGNGPAAKKGNTVSMRYIGKLQNGKVFDKNTKGKPFTFQLGKGEVIKGWDEGVVGMHVGGERKLTIPSNLAYGKKSVTGIPSDSTLIFEVKLLEIK
ncbi:hypothetical protein APHAL10511_004843 [Amanita phalloides]|nr:hypothetical protein APHAL10511_004843 [Amanita phalloides]